MRACPPIIRYGRSGLGCWTVSLPDAVTMTAGRSGTIGCTIGRRLRPPAPDRRDAPVQGWLIVGGRCAHAHQGDGLTVWRTPIIGQDCRLDRAIVEHPGRSERRAANP